MLVFAILLQSAPAFGETGAMPRLVDFAAERTALRERRFRLEVEPAPVEDAKDRALRGVWRSCGLTGAPVCPSKGKIRLRAVLEPRE